ncbi:MAG: P1 family peptidase, partial [Gemmatimonadota bacterium]|nr:P1 family peptidase [Gemmatimonadota bacterium]
TRDGVMRFLEERGAGYPVGAAGVVPIVTGAIIFDLGLNPDGPRPGADCGYAAAEAAGVGPVEEGSVGAGAGATVGKLRGGTRSVKGGVGAATIRLESNGLIVSALMVVNAVGDVVDPRTGAVVAGVRDDNGGFMDARRLLREEPAPDAGGANTTIGVVLTNARLTKAEANKVAQMAHDGLARAIVPSHTPADGDTMFSMATGHLVEGYSVSQVGALAAEAVADAILSAVRSATGAGGVPAIGELPGR